MYLIRRKYTRRTHTFVLVQHPTQAEKRIHWVPNCECIVSFISLSRATPQNRCARHVGDNDFRFRLLFLKEWILRMTKNRNLILPDTVCDTAGHMERKRSRERDECRARTEIVRCSHCSRTNVFVYTNGILLFWLQCNRRLPTHTHNCTQMFASGSVNQCDLFRKRNNDSVCRSEPAYRHQELSQSLSELYWRGADFRNWHLKCLSSTMCLSWRSNRIWRCPKRRKIIVIASQDELIYIFIRVRHCGAFNQFANVTIDKPYVHHTFTQPHKRSRLTSSALLLQTARHMHFTFLQCDCSAHKDCLSRFNTNSCRHFGEYSATDIRSLDLFMRTNTCDFPLSVPQICLFWFLLLCENERKFIYRDSQISRSLLMRRVGVRYMHLSHFISIEEKIVEKEKISAQNRLGFSCSNIATNFSPRSSSVRIFDIVAAHFCGDRGCGGGFRQHHSTRSNFCILNLHVTSAWPMLTKPLKFKLYNPIVYTSIGACARRSVKKFSLIFLCQPEAALNFVSFI